MRVADRLHEVIETTATETFNDHVRPALEEAGMPELLIEALSARLRAVMAAHLMIKFRRTAEGWEEVLAQLSEQNESEGGV